MIKAFKITYILSITALFLYSCKQTKYVPEGKCLLKKNSIEVDGGKLNKENVAEIVRQKPNFKTLGIKMKLMVYNSVDSTKVAKKRFKKNICLSESNSKKIEKRNEINKKRIEKARSNGGEYYTEKLVKLKDTINPKLFRREWLKYKIGEKPIVFDSIPFNKSINQLEVYLRNKGYYYGSVNGEVDYKENRKVLVKYSLKTGPQYIVDSVFVSSQNQLITDLYAKYVKKEELEPLKGQAFDKDYLDGYRERVAKFMRDETIYGFSSSHMSFVADTFSLKEMKVILKVVFTDRMIRSDNNRDSLISIKHKVTKVNKVYFHISDTIFFDGNFKQKVEQMGLTLLDQQFIRTIDTCVYAEIKKSNSDELDPHRIATFLYNGTLAIDPGVIELQNYLEQDNYYKEYYLERSFSRLLQLGIFQVIKPILLEIPGTNLIDVHYYLAPSKKHSFGIQPRFQNSNGFLGAATSINYTNKNLFGGAQKLTFSISGGFESQPPIFDETLDGEKNIKAGRSFNTFEIGPSVKLELPGLFPTKATVLSKRQRPRTIISTAYNYQVRADFKRHIFQLNYLWRLFPNKTQVFQIGLPFASVIKYVQIDKADAFEARLNQLNDLFLRNAYSDQFIWQDWKMTFEYNNKDREDKKGNLSLYLNSTLDPSGNTVSLFKSYQDTIDGGQYAIFGVGYSQFVRIDNEVIIGHPAGKKKSVHARLQIGGGKPYGNTTTSLPYDYSFFGGGANDNRGWRARALGPGSYKYYLDTNRTATQIGDIRLGGSFEYRFSLGSSLRGAVFSDAGNIWTFNEDINRQGSQISTLWFEQIAVSAGIGLRLDLEFFVIRLDVGMPITNPALPKGARWIFQPRDLYIDEGIAHFGALNYAKYLPKPFTPNLHFGIGYPF